MARQVTLTSTKRRHKTPHLDVTFALKDIERALSGSNPAKHKKEALKDLRRIVRNAGAWGVPASALSLIRKAITSINAGDYNTAVANLREARSMIPERRQEKRERQDKAEKEAILQKMQARYQRFEQAWNNDKLLQALREMKLPKGTLEAVLSRARGYTSVRRQVDEIVRGIAEALKEKGRLNNYVISVYSRTWHRAPHKGENYYVVVVTKREMVPKPSGPANSRSLLLDYHKTALPPGLRISVRPWGISYYYEDRLNHSDPLEEVLPTAVKTVK